MPASSFTFRVRVFFFARRLRILRPCAVLCVDELPDGFVQGAIAGEQEAVVAYPLLATLLAKLHGISVHLLGQLTQAGLELGIGQGGAPLVQSRSRTRSRRTAFCALSSSSFSNSSRPSFSSRLFR